MPAAASFRATVEVRKLRLVCRARRRAREPRLLLQPHFLLTQHILRGDSPPTLFGHKLGSVTLCLVDTGAASTGPLLRRWLPRRAPRRPLPHRREIVVFRLPHRIFAFGLVGLAPFCITSRSGPGNGGELLRLGHCRLVVGRWLAVGAHLLYGATAGVYTPLFVARPTDL